MLIQEVLTDLAPEVVIRRAEEFFTLRMNQYAAFATEVSDHHIRMSSEVAELVIGTAREGEQTRVRGSTSRMHKELSHFLSTLAAEPEEVRESIPGPGVSGAG